jgi:hypothetical protein
MGDNIVVGNDRRLDFRVVVMRRLVFVIALLVASTLHAQDRGELPLAGPAARPSNASLEPSAPNGGDSGRSLRIGPATYLVLTVGNVVDLVTTLESLHSGRGREGNPLWSSANPAGFVVIKTASTLSIAYAMRQLASHGHARAAKVVGYTMGFTLIGVGVHNAMVGRR